MKTRDHGAPVVGSSGAAGWRHEHVARLVRRVGRALGSLARGRARTEGAFALEALEGRTLLEGSFATAIGITLTNGAGSSPGVINPANSVTDNDYYRFRMPGAAGTFDFVSVLADTVNEVVASALDTRVTIFDERDLVTPIVSGVVSGDGTVITGLNNGALTSGNARDGWGGFLGEGGVSYFVIVSSDSSAGAPVAGTFTLRVQTGSTPSTVATDTGIVRVFNSPPPTPQNPPQVIEGTITALQDDTVIRYTAPNLPAFASIVTVNIQAQPVTTGLPLDPRLDIYRRSGANGRLVRVTFDSDAGRLNDSFAAFLAVPGETYWIRIRSDEIRTGVPSTPSGQGNFFLVMDGLSNEFPNPINPVTRLGGDDNGVFDAYDQAGFQSESYTFIAQGEGTAIITAVGQGLFPVSDGALRIFDDTGRQLAFNDNFAGNNPQLVVDLVGGRRYFIVLDGFTVGNQVQYRIGFEAQHTLNVDPNRVVDDHVNTPAGTLSLDDRRRAAEDATPLSWSNPFVYLDGDGNLVRDRSVVIQATGTGRVWGVPDTDLFQFTAPVDMLGAYGGDNDDAGTSLFTGGRFDLGDPNVVRPTASRTLSNYDADDWWYTGRQDTTPTGDQLGFSANTAASGQAEVYALYDWNPLPGVAPPQGVPTRRVLVVGGNFTLRFFDLQGNLVELTNLAGWGWNPLVQSFTWFDVTGGAGANQPVRAITAFDPFGTGSSITTSFDIDGQVVGQQPGAAGGLDPIVFQDLPQVLVAGGDFTSIGGVAANRVSYFQVNPQAPFNFVNQVVNGGWNAIGGGITGTGASVRALAVYDPDDPGAGRDASQGPPAVNRVPDAPDQPLSLFVGGSFATAGGGASPNLAVWSGFQDGVVQQFRTGVVVAQWSPPSFGSSAAQTSQAAQPPAWAINGAVNALAVMDVPDLDGTPPPPPPPPPANLPPAGQHSSGSRLFVAGEFTQIGGTALSTVLTGAPNHVAMFGRVDTQQNQQAPEYAPRLVWDPMGTGTDGVIHALTPWDPVDIGGPIPIGMVVGGQFDDAGGQAAGSIAFWQPVVGAATWSALATGVEFTDNSPGVVRSLTAFTDDQEPMVPLTAGAGGQDPQEILYIGGEFDRIVLGQNQFTRNNVAAFGFRPGAGFTYANFILGNGLGGGVSYSPTNTTTTHAGVYAMADYDDGDPYRWDRHDRPSTRMQLIINADFPAFFDSQIRVYDSNFNVLYEFPANPGADSLWRQGQFYSEPGGMLDPSILVPESAPFVNAPNDPLPPAYQPAPAPDFWDTRVRLQQYDGIRLWGGETYYLEVSGSVRNGAGTGGAGRYDFVVTIDGLPTDLNGDGALDNMNATAFEETNEGNFAGAFQEATQLATGNSSIRIRTDIDPNHPGAMVQNFVVNPSTPTAITHRSDLGLISTIDDTDLYSIRAEFTGTMEIRLNTSNLPDAFAEGIDDLTTPAGPVWEVLFRQYWSRFDSAVRIFDNDFDQIAFNDDNYAVQGDQQVVRTGVEFNDDLVPAGNPAFVRDVIYTRRDARVVFNVVAGDTYYLQVESGQRYKSGRTQINRVSNFTRDLLNPISGQTGQTISDERGFDGLREIDWRYATGSYELFINQMPNMDSGIVGGQTVQDDHESTTAIEGTPIPLGDDESSPSTNGVGSIIGVVRNLPNLPADADLFTITSPGAGLMNIRVTPTGAGNALAINLVVQGPNGIQQGAQLGNGVVGVSVAALPGERFFVLVSGQNGTEGSYRIDVDGVPKRDDHADRTKVFDAPDITLRDFEGQGTVNGSIEQPGDTDLFRFSVVEFGMFTVTVAATTTGFNPFVTVYEVSEDNSGNPILLRVAANDNISGTNQNAQTTFPVTPDRTIAGSNPLRTYPYYYVMVRGSNISADIGTYTVTLGFPATDDHPDAPLTTGTSRDTSQFGSATQLVPDPVTGQVPGQGVVERVGDTDLFQFTAPAAGSASVVVERAGASLLRQRVTILASVTPGQPSILITSATSPDVASPTPSTVSFGVTRGAMYFIVVDADDTGNANTQVVGAYTVLITAPPVDDHPNAGEFLIATPILLSTITGMGQIGQDEGGDASNPRISPSGDTDLFTVSAIQNGTLTITVTPFATALGTIAPRVRIFNNASPTPQQIAIQTATVAQQEVVISITGATTGTRYYILVDAVTGVPGASATGEYRVKAAGPGGTIPPGGTDPAIIDWSQVLRDNRIVIDQRTGSGSNLRLTSGAITPGDSATLIDVSNDRDGFVFRTPRFTSSNNLVFVQVVTPDGSLLDATVRILRAPNEATGSTIVFDADGIPGATANGSFSATPDTDYFIVVDGVGDSIGSYVVKVSARPEKNFLYFPEGFSSGTVREFIAITNPNPVSADYTIFLRYETGDLETVLTGGTVQANSRVQVSINDLGNLVGGLRANAPYAIVIESSQPLSARLDHSDWGGTLGEAFTDTPAPAWNFARVERTPGGVLDYVVFYNPNNFDVNVTMTGYGSGGQVSTISARFGALRRGGWAINDLPSFPSGVFSVVLSSAAADAGNASEFVGIVASLSHYDLVRGSAYGYLGDSGATVQAIPSFTQGSLADSEIVIFNPGTATASVQIVGTYVRAALPTFSTVVDVGPRRTVVLRGSTLGLVQDQPLGLRFVSTQAVSVLASEQQKGDADGAQTATNAGTRFFFGDATIIGSGAGSLYFDTLNFYNPAAIGTTVSVRLLFADGSTPAIIPITLNARGYAELRLHERIEVTSRPGAVTFAVDATAASPFVMTMNYYDLTRGGGFSSGGLAFGLTTPLARIL